MRIIPVLDIQNGLVVRGKGGNRSQYRPIQSQLARSAEPDDIGQAFQRLGLPTVYIADLDAITGGEPQWPVYERLADLGLRLWIDAGLRNAASATSWRDRLPKPGSVQGIIAGLETVDSPSALAEILEAIGRELFVFSLDLRGGQPWTAAPGWHGLPAFEIAKIATQAGVARMIVLDVALVGQDTGVKTLPLCRQLRSLDPYMEITTGGGVRNCDDLGELHAAGIDAVLVASALHDGKITVADLLNFSKS